MLNSQQVRELAYFVYITDIQPMDADRLECACIDGWRCVVGKNEFKKNDIAVFFEIDSKLPDKPPFSDNEFLKSKDYKIKSQRIRGVVSQGLLMPLTAFGWEVVEDGEKVFIVDTDGNCHSMDDDSRFLTEQLSITYNVVQDNIRKAKPDTFKTIKQRHAKLFKYWPFKQLSKIPFWQKVFTKLLRRRKPTDKGWPVGKFPGVAKTDQERIENMTWVLADKTPFIRTQKCDGSSGTFILERKGKRKFEFYVCSRNVRMLKPTQQCFYDENYYWQAAVKYDIENKMKDYLVKHPELKFVCWQGEVCGPSIQKNPQGLTEIHLFCFHWTDDTGRWDIREAAKVWKSYNMEVVPIDEELIILPDDIEEFKLTADGLYDPSCCEGKTSCKREGFVYYKTTDPKFSFKNVSREYLLKHGG